MAKATQTVSPATTPTLTSGVWKLQQFLYMSGKTVPVDQPDRYTLEFFTNGRVGVTADCNIGSGNYAADNGRMIISDLVMTQRTCPPSQITDQFMLGLNMAATHAFNDGSLVIMMRYDGGDLFFKH